MSDPIDQKAYEAWARWDIDRVLPGMHDRRKRYAFVAGYRAAAEEGRRHDCESWRDEGLCCANCNPTATALPWPGPVQALINQAQTERDEALEALRNLRDMQPFSPPWHSVPNIRKWYEVMANAERLLSARRQEEEEG